MSHTVHWSNNVKEHTMPNYGSKNSKFFKRYVPDLFREKLGFPTSSLSFQADVLYPNALASVTKLYEDQNATIVPDPVVSSGIPSVLTGCKGNRLDNPFPLEPRVPVALPLVQYPTRTDNSEELNEHDACAVPVLNWEKYILNFHDQAKQFTEVKPLGERQLPPTKERHCVKRELKLAKARLRFAYERQITINYDKLSKKREARAAKLRRMVKLAKRTGKSLGIGINDRLVSPVVSSEDEVEPTNEDVDGARKAVVINTIESIEKVNTKKHIDIGKVQRTCDALRKSIYDNFNFDVERAEHDFKTPRLNNTYKKQLYKKLIRNIRVKDLLSPNRDRTRISLETLRKYTRQPEYKIMATWNYLYNGHGACDWIRDVSDHSKRNLLVGCGTKLRMAAIKPALAGQMISYTVESMWEEDSFPTNIKRRTTKLNDEPLSDLILQIVAARKGRTNDNIAAVRRGRSIEIYRFDGIPSLVTSIANICYGTKKYRGFDTNSPVPVKSNPILVSFDLNPWFPEELVMRDENNILTFVDFARGDTIYQTKPIREFVKNFAPIKQAGYPEIHLNEASGVMYANHPRVCYGWANSYIHFYDYRANLNLCTNGIELLNLQTNEFVRSWSEQSVFTDKSRTQLEAVSMVKQSGHNSMCYHVATTDRVLLMDLRVPQNPVLKMSHGLKSTPAYLDVVNNDNFEVVVAGSQRIAEAFCAVYDGAHVSCAERVDCTARNPILFSNPRHLLPPSDFFYFAETQNGCPAFESDYRKAKDHCYGWSTGMALMKLPRCSASPTMPPPFVLFTGNNFGDLFCQEWHQQPIDEHKKILRNDRVLTDFVQDWKRSMTANNPNEFYLPSQNPKAPVDCSVMVEINAELIKLYSKPRKDHFDAFTLDEYNYFRLKSLLKPLPEQLKNLRQFDSKFSAQLLDVWEHTGFFVPNQNPEQDEISNIEGDGGEHSQLTLNEQRVLAELKQEDEQIYYNPAENVQLTDEVEAILPDNTRENDFIEIDNEDDGNEDEVIIPDAQSPENQWEDFELSSEAWQEDDQTSSSSDVNADDTNDPLAADSSRTLPTSLPGPSCASSGQEFQETKISTDSDVNSQFSLPSSTTSSKIRSQPGTPRPRLRRLSIASSTLDEQMVQQLFPAQSEFQHDKDQYYFEDYNKIIAPPPDSANFYNPANLDPEAEEFTAYPKIAPPPDEDNFYNPANLDPEAEEFAAFSRQHKIN